MWTAGKRFPARAAAVQLTQPQQVVAGRAALVGHQLSQRVFAVAPRQALHQQQQVRTFFGLKELLFGGKKDADKATEAANEAAAKAAATDVSVDPVAAAEDAAVATEATEVPVPLVGSTDTIRYSVGKFARIADGAVMATRGKSMVLSTVVSQPPFNYSHSTSPPKKKDFFPLSVDYRVKYHAAGLIPDTQRRSEMTNTDEEILQSRIIDRVVRPMFPRDYNEDTQIIATVQSLDPTNDPLVLAVNSTSAALAVSDIPWNGPIGCVRVVEIAGQLVANPTASQRAIATLDLLYAASENRTLMIEANGHEIPEDRMAEAMRYAHSCILPLIHEQKALVKQNGKPKREYTRTIVPDDVWQQAKEIATPLLEELFGTPRVSKVDRVHHERIVNTAIITALRAHYADRKDVEDQVLLIAAHDTFQHFLRERILTGDRNMRFDGRGINSIRGLFMDTDVLPMAHGSSVFGRGDTQALCTVTLGPLDRGMKIRSATNLESEKNVYKNAILHYEFPPYCVNETGRLGGVNRRMVGHGALAEKALVPVIPSLEEFPYTIRMTSETMGSDGSSSMATVCGVTMALLDAGVPVKAPVAGISIGLVTEGDPYDGNKPISNTNYKLLTDILGTEDHYGDMDFKIAGTETGITAIQLDVKLPGIPIEILTTGLHHAKKARSYLLKRMTAVQPEPRKQLKASAANGDASGVIHAGVKFLIPMASISALIGSGGSNIREIESTTGCSVSIDRKEGEIHVVGPPDALDAAKAIILEQAGVDSFYTVGNKYEMKVVEIMDFGAILESTAPTKNRGFVHITELAHQRVENIHDQVKVGQVIEFACIMAGVSGKMSRKALLPKLTTLTSDGSGSGVASSTSTTSPVRPPRPTSGMPRRAGASGGRGPSSRSSSSSGQHHTRRSTPKSQPPSDQ